MRLHLHTQSTLSPAVELETRRATANHFHTAKERRLENRERKKRACVRTNRLFSKTDNVLVLLLHRSTERRRKEEEEEKSN
jgi:hypothetical protein